MEITTENNVKQFIISKIRSVYIGFDDNVEVRLDQIVDYDLDLDRIGCSTIELTNVFHDTKMENYFSKNNHIIYVHIEALAVPSNNFDDLIKVFYDIPCDMKIRRLRIEGDSQDCGNMFIELEGIVK